VISSPIPDLEPAFSTHRPGEPGMELDIPEVPVSAAADRAKTDASQLGADPGQVDVREALYNGGSTGTAGEIQVPLERITSLGGFMLDLDPHLIHPDNAILAPSEDPATFLSRIEPILDRHPILRHAEVRASGNGLHLVVRIDPPVELHTHGEQRHWDAMVKIVQRTLPADPNAPGITALTRAVSSINGKNRRPVVRLKDGRPVDQQDVLRFAAEVAGAPFRTIVGILLGAERADCCPLCLQHGLTAYDREGRCYRCGRVGLDRLLNAIFVGREDSPESGGAGTCRKASKGRSGRRG
jgi:hypothetical protein